MLLSNTMILFQHRYQKFTASGENDYFTMGMTDGITIGGKHHFFSFIPQ